MSLVPGSEIKICSDDDDVHVVLCVIIPALWIGFASGRFVRTPRRKAPMRMVLLEERYLDSDVSVVLANAKVVTANRV